MKSADLWFQAFEDVFFAKHFETRASGGATERIAGVTVAVGKGTPLSDRAVKLSENLFGRERHRERQIPTAQALSQNHQIWHYILMLDRKHFAGAPEPGHHFIRNEQSTSLITPSAHCCTCSRRPEPHSRRTLY